MITPLLEDSNQAIDSLNKTGLKISNELSEIANLLEILFDDNHIHAQNIIKDIESIIKLIAKAGEQKKPLDKLVILQTLHNNVKSFISKFHEYISSEQLEEIESLEVKVKYLESVEVLNLIVEVIRAEKDEIEWVKNIDKALNILLELLENNAFTIPNDSLKVVNELVTKLVTVKNLRIYYKSVSPLQQEVVKSHIDSIIKTGKSILWEISNLEEKDSFSTAESILKLVKNSPKWEWGDDFEECLDYINEVRD